MIRVCHPPVLFHFVLVLCVIQFILTANGYGLHLNPNYHTHTSIGEDVEIPCNLLKYHAGYYNYNYFSRIWLGRILESSVRLQ